MLIIRFPSKKISLLFLVVFYSQLWGACFDLDVWLKQHPEISDYVTWQDAGNIKKWKDWKPSDRKLLKHFYDSACRKNRSLNHKSSIFGLPEILANQKNLEDNDFGKTVFSYETAKKYYLSSLALTFSHELGKMLPWTFSASSREQLQELLDSRTFFEWQSPENGYVVNEDKGGLSSPSPPDLVYNFLRSHNIVQASRRKTILSFIQWAGQLTHDFRPLDEEWKKFPRESTRFLDGFWHFRGFPPVLSVLKGTQQTVSLSFETKPTHWTAGCWGTAGLFKNVLRAVNIPVEIRQVANHALLYFPSEDIFLSHGDDPYDQFYFHSPTPDEIFIDGSEWKNLFGEKNSARKNIAIGPARSAIKHLPPYLMSLYCKDVKANTKIDSGMVYNELKNFFSLLELKTSKLWERLREKGCAGESVTFILDSSLTTH